MTLRRGFTACFGVLIFAASAGAATTDQQNCIKANNKNLQKVTSAISKETDKCIKNFAKGNLGIQTVSECIADDPKDKISKAQAKTLSDFASKCTGNDHNNVPKFPSFGATDPNNVNAAATNKETAVLELLFGSDVDAVIITEAADKDASKCQQAVAKSLKKCQDTQLKEFNKCKKITLQTGANSALELEPCILDDPQGKIAKKCDLVAGNKVDKIRKSLDKKCLNKGVDLAAALPGCSESTIADVHACLVTQLNCLTCTAINDADDLVRDCDLLDDALDNESCTSGFPNAAARLITDPDDLIGGLLARGRLQDYLIENNKIRVIIQKSGRNFSGAVGQFGGNPIDADLQRPDNEPGNDLFEEWSLLINIENTANYTNVSVLNDGSDGGPAIVRATGVDDLLDRINPSSTIEDFGFSFPADQDDTDQPVEISTDYILERGENALRIETTVTNIGPDPLDLFLGDYLSKIAQEIFHPGYGVGEPLVTTSHSCNPSLPCDFIAYSQGGEEKGGVSYAYIHTTPGSTSFNTTGVQVSLLGVQALLTLIGAAGPPPIFSDIPNGGSVTITRYLAVGDGDIASVVDTRNRLKGLDTGTVKGTVTSGGSPVEDVEISVLAQNPALGPGTAEHVISQFRTDPNGEFEGTLPVGSFELRANKDGYLFGAPDPGLATIGSGQIVIVNFTMAAPATVNVAIDDGVGDLAGKVSVVGFDPSPEPANTQTILIINNRTGIFGDITKDALPYGLARVVFVDHTGAGSFKLEPGDYQLVFSHGTEYSIDKIDLTAVSGMTHNIPATMVSVLDTTGFVSGDFHVHSFDSPDCAITRKERIISMLAEGMDFFTPSDHEFIADFAPDIAALGVGNLISTAHGNEITPFDYGHFGSFPLTIDPNQVNGGAVDWGRAEPPGTDFPSFGAFNLTPGEIYDAAEAFPGDQMVMIHHVASFFDSPLRFDTGFVPPISTEDGSRVRLDPNVPNYWDDDFDGLEIWIETNRGQIFGSFLGQNAGNWFNLMNQGRVRTGIADSDTHQVFTVQAGFPRNFIASPTDVASAVGGIAQTIATNISDGLTFGTNSPFLRVSVEGDPNELGGLGLGEDTLVRATGGAATFTLDIQSPSWAEFDTVEYYINSETIADSTGRPALPPLYRICPDVIQTDGVEFIVVSQPVNGSTRWEATSVLSLSGLTEDTWVVAMVKGSDGVSCPLFPVISEGINPAENATLAELKLCDLGVSELGINALAFSNPIFLDVDGNGVYDPPGLQFQASCP